MISNPSRLSSLDNRQRISPHYGKLFRVISKCTQAQIGGGPPARFLYFKRSVFRCAIVHCSQSFYRLRQVQIGEPPRRFNQFDRIAWAFDAFLHHAQNMVSLFGSRDPMSGGVGFKPTLDPTRRFTTLHRALYLVRHGSRSTTRRPAVTTP